MKGFENFTAAQKKMIEKYAEVVPSVSVRTSRNGRKVYVIGTWEDDYIFRTKKEFIEAIEDTLNEWAKEEYDA